MDGETAKEEGGVVVCPLDAWRIANGMRVFKERAPATSFTKQIAQRKRSSRCGSFGVVSYQQKGYAENASRGRIMRP